MIRAALVALVAMGLVVFGGVGCGATKPTPHGTTHASSPTGASGFAGPATRVRTHRRPDSERAVSLVRHFYILLNTHQYTRAWDLVPTQVRAAAGGFEQWKAGYRTTVTSRPEDIMVEGSGMRSAVVALDLHATDIDACTARRVPQVFSGTWHLRVVDGAWEPQSTSFHKVAGETPTLDASDCTPKASGGSSARPSNPTPTPSCDPNYTGACLDPNSADYDCAGGTGDGPDYVQGPVQVVGSDPYGLDSDGDGIACE